MPARPHLRTILLALVAALAMVAAACGGEESSEGGSGGEGGGSDLPTCNPDALDEADGVTEITVWHAWVGLTNRTVEAIAEEYNASQDKVKVNVEAQGNYEEMLAKYESAIADPDSLPDIVLSEDTTTQFMIDSATIIPAQSSWRPTPTPRPSTTRCCPPSPPASTVEDVLWPAAFSMSQPVLYANEKHLTAAGLDPTDLPGTLDELRAAAEQIKAAKDAGEPGERTVTEPLVLRMDSWYPGTPAHRGRPAAGEREQRPGRLATESELLNDQHHRGLRVVPGDAPRRPAQGGPYSQPYDQLFAMHSRAPRC